MLRKVLFALIGLAIVLLLDSLLMPARAALKDADVYQWSYANLGSSQLVCKKIAFHPKSQSSPTPSGQQSVQIHSAIVDDSYCAHLLQFSRN